MTISIRSWLWPLLVKTPLRKMTATELSAAMKERAMTPTPYMKSLIAIFSAMSVLK